MPAHLKYLKSKNYQVHIHLKRPTTIRKRFKISLNFSVDTFLNHS
jgi:hypothetical protein